MALGAELEIELTYPRESAPYNLTVFSIATGKYLEYWVDLCRSAGIERMNDPSIQWVIASDLIAKIPEELVAVFGNRLTTIPIPAYGWPQATLLRYQIIYENASLILGQTLMYLDADMIFKNDHWVETIENKMKAKSNIHLVQHPGYYRPSLGHKFYFYLRNLKFILKDLRDFLYVGGLGSWERNPDSLAFVPRGARKDYVCGGCWFGSRNEILEMCEMLCDRVNRDLQKNMIAKFHDESHLNWFATHFPFELESSEFCFDPNYPQLKQIQPLIEAVDKNIDSPWLRL